MRCLFLTAEQSILCCLSGLTSCAGGNLRREDKTAADPFVQCVRSPAPGLGHGEVGQWLARAVPSAKAPLCNWSWPLPLKPPCRVITGNGRVGSCQRGADEPKLLREVPEHQRIGSPGRMQVSTPASPPNISYHEIIAAGGEAEAQLWVTFQG